VFTKADHWHVTISHSVSLTPILILSSHLIINPQVIYSVPIFRGKSQMQFSFTRLFNLILLILIITRPDIVKNFELEIFCFNPLNPELNPICYLLALLGAHHFLHVSRIRVKSLTIRLLMSYIYGAPILDVSRSHTTTQHSR